MTLVGGSSRSQLAGNGHTASFEAVFTCDRCGGLMIGRIELEDVQLPLPQMFVTQNMDAWWTNMGEKATPFARWLPAPGRGKDFPNVPAHIARAANEAHVCLEVGAVMSSVLMSRTVIEATAKEKGITSGSLYKKIDALHAGGFIREFAKEVAHALREFGNDMAHGDISDPVSTVDAQNALDFMDELLNEVFQAPARLQALRQRGDNSAAPSTP